MTKLEQQRIRLVTQRNEIDRQLRDLQKKRKAIEHDITQIDLQMVNQLKLNL